MSFSFSQQVILRKHIATVGYRYRYFKRVGGKEASSHFPTPPQDEAYPQNN